MAPNELIRRCPVLYHVAHYNSWESICRYGLLSTCALLDLFEKTGKERELLESSRRPESVTIVHPQHGTAVIRDQKPIDERRLGKCLQGMSMQAWHRLLNSMVFFWPTQQRLEWFLGAKAYRHDPHCVITVDTQKLIVKCHGEIRVSSINSGSTLSDPPPARGPNTFKTIEEYSFSFPAEVAVRHAVTNIKHVAIRAEVRKHGENAPRKVLWTATRP